MTGSKTSHFNRAAALAFLLAAVALAGPDWVMFVGQVNGPVKTTRGSDLSCFALKKYPGLFWSEGYYHHLNFPDGSMITVSIGFNRTEVNVAFVYGRPGLKPFHDFMVADLEEAKFDDQGFGFALAKNRVRLEGNQYHLDLEFGKVKARIEYEIMSPGYTYGDGLVRYPDGKSYAYYSLPIPWAKVRVHAVLDGKAYELEGSGNMNHDAAVLFPAYTPLNWQVFWFFGGDHALAIADYFAHPKFGRTLVQRLVFMDQAGSMFTSTSFALKWDDWTTAPGIPFRYPRHYSLIAEGGGAKIEVEARLREILLLEDLYSNLPSYLKLIVEHLTRNAWTMDGWADYTATYSHDGKTDNYRGRGILRWSNLEEEK